MDRQSVIGFLVSSAALFLVWFYLFKPTEAEIQAAKDEQARRDSIAQVEPIIEKQNDLGTLSQEDFSQTTDTGAVTSPTIKAEDVVFTNNRWELTVNTKGGLPARLKLKDGYVAYQDSSEVELWDHESDLSYMNVSFSHAGKVLNTRDLFFTTNAQSQRIQDSTEVMFSSDLGNGSQVQIAYTFHPDRYDAGIRINLINAGQVGTKVLLDWKTAALHQEKGIYNEQLHSSVFFKTFSDGRDYLGESREDDETVDEKLNWVCHKQNYFSVLAISRDGFDSGAYLRSYPNDLKKDSVHSTYYESLLPLSNNHTGNGAYAFDLYMGPNDLDYLGLLNAEDVVKIPDYGWSIFGWVNRNLIAPLFNQLSTLGWSAGILIFILTFIVKLVLSPVQWKNYMNSAKMKAIRPEIDELNKKYENKPPMEKQQATMALYRKCGVNPMAGCLPALLQMPLLYAMFRFFPACIDLRQKSFLWADDLGSYDAIFSWSQNIPLVSSIYGNHVSGFTVMMAVSMFFYTRMSAGNMPTQTQPGMPNMKAIMNIFPVVMLIFFNKFASGLSLYYFLANIFSIGQMWFIKRFLIDENSIRAKIEENKKKPAKKKSAFAQRLEEMQKEQQKKMAQQQKKKK